MNPTQAQLPRRARGARNAARIGALATGLVLAAAVGEGTVRAARERLPAPIRDHFHATLTKFSSRPHAYLNWELVPGVIMKTGEEINAQGFRGPHLTMPKQDGVFRVACLGGSTTFTTNVKDRNTYPAALQQALHERCPNGAVEVLNAGVPGYTSAESLMNLALKVLDYEPDLVVVYHAYNDYRPRTYPGFQPDYGHYRRVWVEEDSEVPALVCALEHSALFRVLRLGLTEFRRHTTLYYWISRVEDAPVERAPLAPGIHLEAFRSNLDALADLCGARRIHLMLVTQALNAELAKGKHSDAVREHNLVSLEVAATRGVLACDAAAGFPQEFTFRTLDPVHMTAAGAVELARRIAGAIVAADVVRTPAPRARIAPRAPASAGDAGANQATHVPDVDLRCELPPLPATERAALQDGHAFTPLPFCAYAPRAGMARGIGIGPHDEHGLRGPPCAPTKAPGTARVLCLGGASTYGLGVDADASFPAVLARLLGEDATMPVEVLNAGVPGHTTAESIAAFHFRLRHLKPDVVVIAHDAEDAAPLFAPGFRTDYAHWRKTFRLPDSPPRGNALLAVAPRRGDDRLGAGAPLAALRPADRARLAADSAEASAPPRPYAVYRNLLTLVDLAAGSGAQVVLVDACAGPGAGAGYAAALWNRAAMLVGSERSIGRVAADPAPPADHFHPGCAWLPNGAGLEARAHRVLPQVRAALAQIAAR